MSRFFSFFLVLSLGAFIFLWWIPTPCEKVLTYRIGTIDPRFSLSLDDAIQIVSKMEILWETPLKKELFQYDPTSDFRIDFVFDERQERTGIAQTLKEEMSILNADFLDFETHHADMRTSYEKKLSDYESSLSRYNTSLNALNRDIESWNAQGGAPAGVYEIMENKRLELLEEQKQLEASQVAINALRLELNQLAEEALTVQAVYNEKVAAVNTLYENDREFSQGTWFPDRIEIYEFEDQEQLLFLLAHEFGHALGLDHVSDKTAIMYAFMEDQNFSELSVTQSDIKALNMYCDQF